MPKRQLAIFAIVDVILMVAVLVAVFHHIRVVYAMAAFIVLSVLNGIFLIVTVVGRTGTP